MGRKNKTSEKADLVENSESKTSNKSGNSDESGTTLLSKQSENSLFEELQWNHALVRHPAGPCYKLKLDQSLNEEEDNERLLFSRECSDESKYHSDLLHAIAADMDLDVDSLHENAQRLDLVYVNTLASLLMETRVLTNSV